LREFPKVTEKAENNPPFTLTENLQILPNADLMHTTMFCLEYGGATTEGIKQEQSTIQDGVGVTGVNREDPGALDVQAPRTPPTSVNAINIQG
jgi:hypothetical protein